MKAKVIETGEIVNVTPYPTWYKENGQGPDRREWDEDELEFIYSNKKEEKLDLEKEIKNEIDNLSNLYCYMEDLFNGNEEEGVYPIPEKVTNELLDFAKHFYELGLKTQKGEL